MRFGNPITGSPITPGTVIQSPNTVLSSYAFPNNWTSELFDVSGWDSLIVSLGNGIAASGGSITFQWFDALGQTPIIATSGFPTTFTLPQGACSLSQVGVRNVGAFVQITSTGWGDTGHSLTVWGTNRPMPYDGPMTRSVWGNKWCHFTQAMGAGSSATVTVWGRTTGGAQTSIGYCGPARLVCFSNVTNGYTEAYIRNVAATDTIAMAGFTTTDIALCSFDFWAPPEPIIVGLTQLSVAANLNVTLYAGEISR